MRELNDALRLRVHNVLIQQLQVCANRPHADVAYVRCLRNNILFDINVVMGPGVITHNKLSD